MSDITGEFAGYGSGHWRTALVSPEGQILDMKTLGHSGSCQSGAYAALLIKEFLKNCDYCGADLVARNPYQALCLAGLREWHCFRLTWGVSDPEEAFASGSDGKSLDFALHYCANGKNERIFQGSLPEDWWELDDTDRQCLLEEMAS
jgi:hypothetical protein